MAMDRWDPFRDVMTLREAMDRWLQQSISGTGQLLSNIRPDSIPVDVVERDDAFEIRAAVPGVKPEDVEVTVQGERISLRAEARADEDRRGDNWLMREHRLGTLQRSITLPAPVSSENAEARIENGVLSLRLPKLQGAAPRRINVSTASATHAATSMVGLSGDSGGQGAASPVTPATTNRPDGGHPASSSGGNTAHGSRDHTAEGDRVTEESQESFPASDPPSWTPEKH